MAHGDTSVRRVAVSTEVIDADELRRLVADPAAGACVVFIGDVRDNDHQRSVVSLTYEAHPSAREALERTMAVGHDTMPGGGVLPAALKSAFIALEHWF